MQPRINPCAVACEKTASHAKCACLTCGHKLHTYSIELEAQVTNRPFSRHFNFRSLRLKLAAVYTSSGTSPGLEMAYCEDEDAIVGATRYSLDAPR